VISASVTPQPIATAHRFKGDGDAAPLQQLFAEVYRLRAGQWRRARRPDQLKIVRNPYRRIHVALVTVTWRAYQSAWLITTPIFSQ
jgi:hypothetical protein